MSEKFEFLNSQKVANILNVNVSTIKRWTDEGKLECTKTAGGHRKFLMSHINQFLNNSKIKTSWDRVVNLNDPEDSELNYYLLQKDFDFLIDYIVDAASWSQREKINRIIQGLYLNQTEIFNIFDSLLTPALHKIGDLWETGEISVIVEHVSSQIIRDSIVQFRDMISIPKEKSSTALLMVMSSELHDIALKMVNLILQIRGINVIFAGQKTPSLKIEQVFEIYQPDRIYISSTVSDDVNVAQAEFDKICFLAKNKNIEVVIGGQGFDVLDYKHFKNVKRLNTFEEVSKY